VNKGLKVGNLYAEPGTKVTGYLEVPGSYVKMPTTLINGARSGKIISITAGIHGGEYPGIEAVIGLAGQLEPLDITGQLILVHIVNVPAFEAKLQGIGPDDGKNLNRVFPGKATGTVTEKIAYAITEMLHEQSDFYMDLHSGDIHEELMPFVLYHRDADEKIAAISKKAASLMNFDLVIGSESTVGTINTAAMRGVPGILAELGQSGYCCPEDVIRYQNGIMNVLRYFGVVNGVIKEYENTKYLHRMYCINSDEDGCWYRCVAVRQKVVTGEKMGETKDYFGKVIKEYFSPIDGLILYATKSLAIRKGDSLIAIA
jgi:predicted deacylase